MNGIGFDHKTAVDFDEEQIEVFDSPGFNVVGAGIVLDGAENYFDSRLFDCFRIYRDYHCHT
jgi:hypothetical protein